MTHPRYVSLLALLYAVLWVALAIAPLHRDDWMLENALVVLAGAVSGARTAISRSRASRTR